MLKIEKTETYGWQAAVRGMRNPLNSWHKQDSMWDWNPESPTCGQFVIGENDLDLMKRLASGGSTHGKYRRMITVTCDITAPLYWWKEFDTYKIGTVANSCSTMHKIQAKEFTLDDFSHEHLDEVSKAALMSLVNILNSYRIKFNRTKDKKDWWQMIQLLPTSYNQKRTVQMNYEVLAGIYPTRKDHKLDEWHTFCDWIKELPHAELITGGEAK